MERRRAPIHDKPDTGRLGFRYDTEPRDERPLLVEYACQCKGCRQHSGPWRDMSEKLEYEHAVETMPREPGEGPIAYIQRLSAAVTGRMAQAVSAMPRKGMSRGERDRKLASLRAQASGMGDGWEDYT